MDFSCLVWKRVWKITFFWSEIRSGFEEPGGTPPQRIPRSTPRGNSFTYDKVPHFLVAFQPEHQSFLGEKGKDWVSKWRACLKSFSAVLSSLFPKKRLILQASSPLQDSISLAISITAIENHLWLRIVVKFNFSLLVKNAISLQRARFFLPFYFNCCRYWRKFAIFEPYYSQMNKRIV